MTSLQELRERIGRLTSGDREVDMLVMCALAAPADCWVEQSRINGAWCIMRKDSRDRPASWEWRNGQTNWWRNDEWPVTSSLDAALALVERAIPDCNTWSIEKVPAHGKKQKRDEYEAYLSRNYVGAGHWAAMAVSVTPALAVVSALLDRLIDLSSAPTPGGDR
jgi:hypothetical protein